MGTACVLRENRILSRHYQWWWLVERNKLNHPVQAEPQLRVPLILRGTKSIVPAIVSVNLITSLPHQQLIFIVY
jgi:hypothetical protein